MTFRIGQLIIAVALSTAALACSASGPPPRTEASLRYGALPEKERDIARDPASGPRVVEFDARKYAERTLKIEGEDDTPSVTASAPSADDSDVSKYVERKLMIEGDR